MRRTTGLVLALALFAPLATARADDPRSDKEKKGALKEQKDPARDLKLQKENLEKLRANAAADRKAGNHVGAWAADQDARHAEKLIKKDEKLLEEHKTKTSTEDDKGHEHDARKK